MKVDKTNLRMIRGDSESITVSFNDEDQKKIILAAGDQVYFTVKVNTSVQEKVMQKLITVFEAGNAVIEIEPAETSSLAYRNYTYEIQWVNANGRVTTVVPPSIFKIEPEVTFE